MSLIHESQTIQNQLVTWRRHLHQRPELSFQETETQQYILGELRAMGLNPTAIAKTGVVVDLGPESSSGVAIRADIDALPLQEESDLPFRSQNDGVMHACGHDGHTAILLGVAKVLSEQQTSLPGKIRLMFQPAEEKIPGGARDLIAAGALLGITRVLGLHLSSDLPTGQAGAYYGAQTANADTFTIVVEGKGGHGSQPEIAIDPIVIAAELILALQTIVSRNIKPRDAAVVTVGTVQAGSNFNIIAPRATLTGTVRTFSPDNRALIQQRITELADAISRAYGASAHVEYGIGYPSVVNTAPETDIAYSVIRRVLGSDGAVPIEPLMAGEDFSYYQQYVPGTFLMLGCGNAAIGAQYPHHHPRFTLDEEALSLGTALLIQTALEFLLINP